MYEARLVRCTVKHTCVQSGLVHSVCVQSGLVCRLYQCIYTTRLGLQLHHTSVYACNQAWFTSHQCVCVQPVLVYWPHLYAYNQAWFTGHTRVYVPPCLIWLGQWVLQAWFAGYVSTAKTNHQINCPFFNKILNIYIVICMYTTFAIFFSSDLLHTSPVASAQHSLHFFLFCSQLLCGVLA